MLVTNTSIVNISNGGVTLHIGANNLEGDILDLIMKGKYEIQYPRKIYKIDQKLINIIFMDEEVYNSMRRGCPRKIQDPIV